MLRRLQRRQAYVADSFDFLSALIGKLHAKNESLVTMANGVKDLMKS